MGCVGVHDVVGVESFGSGACSWGLRAFPLVLFYCLPAKNENRNGNFDQRCKFKSIQTKLSVSG